MPIQKTVMVYTIDELEEKVRQKVIERSSEDVFDWNWSACAVEDWYSKLKKKGFEDPKIAWSGFYSQGDGASFTTEHIDLDLIAKEFYGEKKFNDMIQKMSDDVYYTSELKLVDVAWGSVKRGNLNYYHEKSVSVDIDFDDQVPGLGAIIEELSTHISKMVVVLSQEIYSDIMTEYESLTSDDSILEHIRESDVLFFKDGRPYCPSDEVD